MAGALDKGEKERHTCHGCSHLVQVWVSSDVIAPLLGADAALGARPGVADSHSRDRGCESRGGVSRGAGEELHSAGRRAPAQGQCSSSWERVHVACTQAVTTTHTTHSGSNLYGQVTFQVSGRANCDLESSEKPGIDSAGLNHVNNLPRLCESQPHWLHIASCYTDKQKRGSFLRFV